MWPQRPFSALPALMTLKASPKAISRRTSYLRVRLEFLPYPQLIPAFFNRRLVRSSMELYLHFNLAMDRSPGFGSTNTNCSPFSDLVSLRLRTSLVLNLANISNSPDRSTKSTQSEISSLLLFVCTRFQVLFHSPPGVLFTFPSQYFSTIGHRLVFRLGGWSPRLPTGFLVSRGTLDPAR